ncbi:patatin-like phospholipase family protein [Mycolicibacterium baixiangningiae]|uniref:patatin-like phospholipase family protein n=1 Tax=Mycolicibacterium baixiangningiae TaxID=2761578 RepID=UPI0018D1C884|nr:patatin-like phospholipase family protein [Mycolicibacterium baixiangningiae]
MTKRALVLAGGGIAGIAWETGVLRGIADEAPDTARDLLGAEILVGTSAGSTVAAQIGSGLGIEALYDRQLVTTSAEIDPGVSIETITGVFLAAMSDPDANVTEKLRRIGEIALSTPTVAEDVRRAVIEQRLPSHEWPDRDLRVTAIDTATGELVTFDRSSGVSLVDAVAASCAVPGVWPPVTIGPRRFMDGGVGSTVNMGVAADCDAAVALVPSGRSSPSPFGSGAVAEVDGFAAPTFGIFADDEALAAFGPNPLDPACRVPSAEAGRAQGRRVAADVVGFFSGLQ